MKEASMAASGVDAVTLDPWHEPGIPLEEQYRSWKQRIKAPYDKHEVDAYTRTRVILMNGVEVGAWNFSHHFARSTDDFELRSLLAGPGWSTNSSRPLSTGCIPPIRACWRPRSPTSRWRST
jgi:hypothetical protein